MRAGFGLDLGDIAKINAMLEEKGTIDTPDRSSIGSPVMSPERFSM